MPEESTSGRPDFRFVLDSQIEIIHGLESRDYNSFYRELEKQGIDKITEWLSALGVAMPSGIMSDAEYDEIRQTLSKIDYSGPVYHDWENDADCALLDLPPLKDYRSYGHATVSGKDISLISRIQHAIDKLLFFLDVILHELFSTDSDTSYGFCMAVNMNENFSQYEGEKDINGSAFSALITIEQSIYWREKNYMSGFRPMYEETLASLFRIVYSDSSIRTWDLKDVSYPLSKIRKAGKLILPEKKVSLLICRDLGDAGGKYSEYLSVMKVQKDRLQSIIHEIGHAAYHHMELSTDEMFDPIHDRFRQILEGDDGFNPSGEYGMDYFTDRSECFARCYEMYIADCGFSLLDGKLKGSPYPADAEFRLMVKDYFDKLTGTVTKESVHAGLLDQYCNATE